MIDVAATGSARNYLCSFCSCPFCVFGGMGSSQGGWSDAALLATDHGSLMPAMAASSQAASSLGREGGRGRVLNGIGPLSQVHGGAVGCIAGASALLQLLRTGGETGGSHYRATPSPLPPASPGPDSPFGAGPDLSRPTPSRLDLSEASPFYVASAASRRL